MKFTVDFKSAVQCKNIGIAKNYYQSYQHNFFQSSAYICSVVAFSLQIHFFLEKLIDLVAYNMSEDRYNSSVSINEYSGLYITGKHYSYKKIRSKKCVQTDF